MGTFIGASLLVLAAYAIWSGFPPEKPEIIEARKKYGKINLDKGE